MNTSQPWRYGVLEVTEIDGDEAHVFTILNEGSYGEGSQWWDHKTWQEECVEVDDDWSEEEEEEQEKTEPDPTVMSFKSPPDDERIDKCRWWEIFYRPEPEVVAELGCRGWQLVTAEPRKQWIFKMRGLLRQPVTEWEIARIFEVSSKDPSVYHIWFSHPWTAERFEMANSWEPKAFPTPWEAITFLTQEGWEPYHTSADEKSHYLKRLYTFF